MIIAIPGRGTDIADDFVPTGVCPHCGAKIGNVPDGYEEFNADGTIGKVPDSAMDIPRFEAGELWNGTSKQLTTFSLIWNYPTIATILFTESTSSSVTTILGGSFSWQDLYGHCYCTVPDNRGTVPWSRGNKAS